MNSVAVVYAVLFANAGVVVAGAWLLVRHRRSARNSLARQRDRRLIFDPNAEPERASLSRGVPGTKGRNARASLASADALRNSGVAKTLQERRQDRKLIFDPNAELERDSLIRVVVKWARAIWWRWNRSKYATRSLATCMALGLLSVQFAAAQPVVLSALVAPGAAMTPPPVIPTPSVYSSASPAASPTPTPGASTEVATVAVPSVSATTASTQSPSPPPPGSSIVAVVGSSEVEPTPSSSPTPAVVVAASSANTSTGTSPDLSAVFGAFDASDAGGAGSIAPSPSPTPQLGVVLSTGRHRTFVDVTWNGEPRGKVLAVFDDTGDIWLSRGDLSAFGVPAGSAACLTESEMCYLALADFKSSLAFTFSTDTLTLTVKTTASLLEQKTIDFANPAPHFDNAHITGNVLNYALTVLPHSSFAGTLDDRFGVAKNVVVEAGAGRTTDGLLQRTYTDVTIDNPQSEERTIVGDTTAVGGDLGGSFQMGGVVVQRQFSLDPYAVNFPTPSLRTAITQPSTAQILVNGVVVRTVDLPPGYYDLNSLPIATGINNAQVIIRNAYGQQTYDVGEYGAVTLLRKGLTDYQYGVGFLRENVGLPNEGYGPFAASAHYRLGLSDVATIGAVAQESNGLTNGGVDYDVQLGPGVLHAGVGGSFGRASGLSSNGTTDVQLSGLRANGTTEVLGYSSNASRFGASFLLQAQTPGYTQIQSFIPEFVTQHAAILTLSTEISRSLSVSASEQATKYAGAGTLAQTTFGVSKQLGKWSLAGSYSIGATPTQAGIPGGTTRSVAVSLLRSLWSTGNSTGSEAVNMQTGPNAVSGYQITTTATSPLLSSYNLAIQNRSGGGIGIGGWANIGTPYATLDLLSQPGGGSGGLSATLSGALTTTRKGTYFTQPVQDGYALVDVGLPNVPVYVNGQYAGATNHSGAMVAPFLQSNLQNTISVSSRGLPMTEMLGNGTDSNVGPSYHNGTVVKVQAQSVHAVRGIVLLRAGAQDVIPMYGDAVLSLSGTTYSSPIDDTGRVYWQGIRAGRYQLTVTLPTRSCTTSIDVPRFSEAVYNLGTIRCAGATVAR